MSRSDGIIGWMVRNRVVPNLLMVVLLAGGLFTTFRIKREVFPEFDIDRIRVQVSYPGASPEEIERGIVTALENAVRGLDGIEEISAQANEGAASLTLELEADADREQTVQNVRQAVDRVRTLPENAERAEVTLVARRREVMRVALYGDVEEASLRELAETVRDRLLESSEISQVDVIATRGFEVQVTLNAQKLRAYSLTHAGVAARIRTASIELPGGEMRTEGGDVLVRVSDRREDARDIAKIPLITTEGGGVVRLRDVADIREDFEERPDYDYFNGKRSVDIAVYRVGMQTPIGVSDEVQALMPQIESNLPAGVDWQVLNDRSNVYRQRLNLLLKNACIGLLLVMALLGVFLDMRLAFWVTMGIPTSFLGAVLLLPLFGVSINIISMFAFIVALGIVVDDAIVAGENIYEYRQRGLSFADAAVRGARDVAAPIGFAICSNIITFLPLAFIPGVIGNIWKVIPFVVISAFIISWVESLLILPAHLAHEPKPSRNGFLSQVRTAFDSGLQWVIRRAYVPLLRGTVRWRLVTIAGCAGLVFLTFGFVQSGRIGRILMPRVESDVAVVSALLPDGAPQERVDQIREQLTASIVKIGAEQDNLITGVRAKTEDKQVEVFAYLSAPEVRPMATSEVVRLWRQRTGPLEGVLFARFVSDRGGPGSGAGVTVELSHRDIERLEQASAQLAKRLREFPAVKDIDEGVAKGADQLDIRLSPSGASLGLTSAELARQLRGNFYGAEALRYQRGRHEFRILVRQPDSGRDSADDIDGAQILTPQGTRVPLHEVATIERGRSFRTINRRDAKRTVTVRANVNPISETSQVLSVVRSSIMPELRADIPGLSYSFRGRQRSFQESLSALGYGLLLSIVAMYFLLAVAFRDYFQPLVVMAAIPLGAVGAVAGHWLLGFNLSILSLMGFIALSGVLVNDALVLVTYANGRRAAGRSPSQAIMDAAQRRFRPVLLTTLTTFGGLAPMIFETSRQARFIIPMAISLGFGILLATAVTLVLVPSLYVVLEDARSFLGSLGQRGASEGVRESG